MLPEVFSFFFPFDDAKVRLFFCVRKQFDDYFANITVKLMYVKCLCACTVENGPSPVLRTPSPQRARGEVTIGCFSNIKNYDRDYY